MRSSSGTSPALASSIGTPCSSSTSAAASASAVTSLSTSATPLPYSQPRSSRSCRRAIVATRAESPAWRWISASVCRTESWIRAATSARSSSRIRSVRSTVSCHTHGPTTRSSAPATAPGARKPPLAPRRPRKITAPAISNATPSRGSEPPGRSEPPAARTVTRPGDEQRRPEQRRSRQAEREEDRARRDREQGRRRQRAPAPRVDPQREIDEDAGPARESEDREDQPHEGRVDGESCCDAAAHARDHAVVAAALEQQCAQRSASTNDGDLPEPDCRVDHVAAPSAGLDDRVPP